MMRSISIVDQRTNPANKNRNFALLTRLFLSPAAFTLQLNSTKSTETTNKRFKDDIILLDPLTNLLFKQREK